MFVEKFKFTLPQKMFSLFHLFYIVVIIVVLTIFFFVLVMFVFVFALKYETIHSFSQVRMDLTWQSSS